MPHAHLCQHSPLPTTPIHTRSNATLLICLVNAHIMYCQLFFTAMYIYAHTHQFLLLHSDFSIVHNTHIHSRLKTQFSNIYTHVHAYTHLLYTHTHYQTLYYSDFHNTFQQHSLCLYIVIQMHYSIILMTSIFKDVLKHNEADCRWKHH